jgi:hypothetical protein
MQPPEENTPRQTPTHFNEPTPAFPYRFEAPEPILNLSDAARGDIVYQEAKEGFPLDGYYIFNHAQNAWWGALLAHGQWHAANWKDLQNGIRTAAGLFPSGANVPTPEQLARLERDDQLVDNLESLPDLAPDLPTTGEPEPAEETSEREPAHNTPEQPDRRKKDMMSTAAATKMSTTGTTTGSGSPPLNG